MLKKLKDSVIYEQTNMIIIQRWYSRIFYKQTFTPKVLLHLWNNVVKIKFGM